MYVSLNLQFLNEFLKMNMNKIMEIYKIRKY